MSIRRPAVAGRFYPADPAELARLVDGWLAGATPSDPPPRALIVPHAGYIYSGPVAASAYRMIAGAAIRRVVLLGPAHFVPTEGVLASSADAWSTPLGEVPVERNGHAVDDDAHEPEHSLEVQLPFLQRALDDLTILPLLVQHAAPGTVADALDDARDALVVVSSDLSHYHDYDTAARLDRRTADAIVERDPDGIGPGDACGAAAIRGVLAFALRHDLKVTELDLCTSGDTAGPRDRVVGYGAFALA